MKTRKTTGNIICAFEWQTLWLKTIYNNWGKKNVLKWFSMYLYVLDSLNVLLYSFIFTTYYPFLLHVFVFLSRPPRFSPLHSFSAAYFFLTPSLTLSSRLPFTILYFLPFSSNSFANFSILLFFCMTKFTSLLHFGKLWCFHQVLIFI